MRMLLTFALAMLLLPLRADTSLPSLKGAAKQVRPSVVNLSIVKNVKGFSFSPGSRGGTGDPLMDQFFGRFFGEGQREQMFKQRSLGSGRRGEPRQRSGARASPQPGVSSPLTA